MLKLNVKLIEKLIAEKIQYLKTEIDIYRVPRSSEEKKTEKPFDYMQAMLDIQYLEETQNQINELKTIREPTLFKYGGNWLGNTRNWIQWNCRNGDSVTWSSNEFLKVKAITVSDIERFGAEVASAAIREVFKF